MTRLSQYVDPYLYENGNRGNGRGLTVKSYLSYVLRGKARNWAIQYYNSLRRSLELLEASGQVVRGRSRCGGVAWYPRPECEEA